MFQESVIAGTYIRWKSQAVSLRGLTEAVVEGARRDKTEARWQASALPGSDGTSGAFHFELRNSLDAGCDGCSLNSDNFVIARRKVSSSISSVATATATSTQALDAGSSSTTAPSSTTAVSGAQSTNASESITPERGSNNDLSIGLGVGLGLGIPLLLAITAATFCLRRRRKRRNSLPRGRQPSPADSPDHASGAWLYQDGRQSQQSTMFRPSTTARSEMSSWSHRSWIEPFEFEQMEMRDQDSISQLRHSIYSNSRSRVSQASLSNTASERDGLEGIPEQPQAVHGGRWSHT